MTVRLAILCALVAGACSNLERLDLRVCGNGIVELGEDCDSRAATCEACGIRCETTEQCAERAGPGFVCGVDDFCHAGAGTFRLGGEAELPVTSYRVTDVDGDEIGDVLAQSQTAITVLYGNPDGEISTSASIQTPFARGPAIFAQLDGGSIDAIMPTADGIVAYHAPFDVPAPYPFPSEVRSEMGLPLFTHPISPTILGIVNARPGTQQLTIQILEVGEQVPRLLGAGPLCPDGGVKDDFAQSDIDFFELEQDHLLLAVTLRPVMGAPRLCMVAIDREEVPDADPFEFDVTEVPLATVAAPSSRPMLADLRLQQCPSLWLREGNALREYLAQSNARPCSFATASRRQIIVQGEVDPVGTVVLSPTIGGAAAEAVVLSDGIYKFDSVTQAIEPLYRADRALGAVRHADLDNDGDLDVVASGENTDDLDILDRLGDGFLRYRLDTEAPTGAFLIGDYDGNTIADVAYIERRFSGERLLIAYGTTDQLLRGVVVGAFARVNSMVNGDVPDATDPLDVIDDLVVLYEYAGGTAAQLALLHGSPQRTMQAFFDPRPREQDEETFSVFDGVAAGHFGGTGGGNDLVAFEAPTVGGVVNLWLSLGAMGGELEPGNTQSPAAQIRTCTGLSNDAFCIGGARFVAWPVAPGHDLVVGFDRKLKSLAFDPRLLVPTVPAPITMWSRAGLGVPDTHELRSVSTMMLPEGAPRLLLSTIDEHAEDPLATGMVAICDLDLTNGPRCEDLGATISAAVGKEAVCVDVAIANVTPARRFVPPLQLTPDLIVLCHHANQVDTLYRVSTDRAIVQRLLDVPPSDALQIGDVTGDGLDDIITLAQGAAVPLLRIFPQCTSRETTGCRGGE